MSRKIDRKIVVSGTLIASTPVAVGGIGQGEHVDLELAQDATGAYCIPGTSLAGPMRAWFEEQVDDQTLADRLFGYVEEKSERSAGSSLLIEDSRVVGGVFRERRHGIAIDIARGTTQDRFFYTRALLPRGTRFKLNIELDIAASADDSAESSLRMILSALERGEIRFGACKTRGMGRMRLEDIVVDRYDFLSDKDALDDYLNDRPSSRRGGLEVLNGSDQASRSGDIIEMEIRWSALSPIMVKDGRNGFEADMLPLMSGIGNEKITPVIPGSSLKGVLRAQAERILNTMLADSKTNADALISDLFGSQENAGLLSIDDVYCDTKSDISLSDWLSEDVECLSKSPTERRQHVAIDRFTGGASGGALYSARAVKRDMEWEPIRMTLRLPKDGDGADRMVAIAMINLLLRDMRDGFVKIGFGSRRGMGAISADISSALHEIERHATSMEELKSAWNRFVSPGGGSYSRMVVPQSGSKRGG